MRTKSYNKKKLLSLVMLPILANSFATQAVHAGITNNPPTTGDTVVISGAANTTPVDAGIYNATDVSVQLEAGAELTVDGSYPYYSAIYLLEDSSVVLDVGAQVTISSGLWLSGVYVYSDSSDSETNIDLSAGSSITAQDAYFATGVDLYAKYSEDSTFDITLDGASIEASGEYFAAGISLDEYDSGYFRHNELTIELSDSSITATNYNAAGGLTPSYGAAYGIVVETDSFWDPDFYEAPAVNIDLYTSSITASSNLGYATGVLFDNYVEGGSLDLILDKGSSIDVTATNLYYNDSLTTMAYAGGVVMLDVEEMNIDLEESSINVSAAASQNYNAVSLATGIYSGGFLNEQLDVTLREGSSMTVSSSVTDAESAYAIANGIDLYAGYAEGGISVELNTGSSIDVQAHVSDVKDAYAMAGGIEAQTIYEEGGEVEVLLDLGSSVTVLANSATHGPNAIAAATGIFASTAYDDVDVTIDNGSSVDATAVATSGFMTPTSGEPGAPYGSAAAISVGINTTPINFDESLIGFLGGEPTALAPSMDPSLESTVTLYNSAVSSTATAAAVDSAIGAAVGTANFALESGGTSLVDSSVSATATVVTNSIGLEEPMLPISGALAAGVLDIGGTVDLSTDGLGGNEVTVDAAHTAYNSAALAVALGIENLAMMEDGQARVDAEYATIDVSATADGATSAYAMVRGVEAMAGLGGLLAGPEAAATVFSAPGDATVTLNSATVSVDATALAGSYDAGAQAYAVSAMSSYGDATISLLDSDIDAQANARTYNSAVTTEYFADAEAYGVSAFSAYNASVLLDSTTVDTYAKAVSDEGDAFVDTDAVDVDAFMGDAYVSAYDVDLSATAIADAADEANADADGIKVYSGYNAVVLLDTGSVSADATATATANDADADVNALDVVVEGNAFVSLTDFTVDADAAATVLADATEDNEADDAQAEGIDIWSRYNTTVLLDNVSVDADATATSYQDDADNAETFAVDIFSNEGYAYLSVTDSTLNANSVATVYNSASVSNSAEADAEAYGIDLYAGYNAAVLLNNSAVLADGRAISHNGAADTDVDAVDVNAEGTAYVSLIDTVVSAYGLAASDALDDDEEDVYTDADVNGIEVNARYNATVLLDGGSVVAEAKADGLANYVEGYADAVDVDSDENVYLDVQGTFIAAYATATGADSTYDARVDADADALDVWGGEGVTVILNSASVIADAAAVSHTDTAQSEAQAIDVNNEYSDAYVSLTDTGVAAYASSTVYNTSVVETAEADAEAYGIEIYSDGDTTLLLNGGFVVADAQAINHRFDDDSDSADADTEAIEVMSEGAASLTLTETIVDATAYAMGDNDSSWASAESDVEAIQTWSFLDQNIVLNSATLSAAATATSAYAEGYASATGIDAGTRDNLDVSMINGSSITATTAVDAYASAEGYAYGADLDGAEGVNVVMNSATITVGAETVSVEGYAEAVAQGIDAYSSDGAVDINLINGSLIDVTAETDGYNRPGWLAYASGIYAYSYDDMTVTLDDSDVAVTADAYSEYGRTFAFAGGIFAEADIERSAGSTNSSTVTLTDAAVNVTAVAYGAAQAEGMAYGVFAGAEGDVNVTLEESSAIIATAYAESTDEDLLVAAPVALGPPSGTFATAMALEMYSGYESESVTLDASESVIAAYAKASSADEDVFNFATATAISSQANGDTNITLTNSAVLASAVAEGEFGDAYAMGIEVNMPKGNEGDSVDLNLYGSSVTATAEGEYGSGSTGIFIGNVAVNSATINIDEYSSVTADWAIDSKYADTTEVNNDGLIDGRVYVQDFNNSGTAVLRASVSSESEVLYDPEDVTGEHYAAYTDGSSFFTGTNSAYMAEGTTMQIYLEDGLTFDQQGDVVQLYMVEAGSGAGYSDWYANYGANVTVEQYGYDSPILTLEYSETYSTDQNFIVDATLLTRDESGISKNADNAVGAAATDGRLDFNSDPEEWVPDVSGVAAGANLDLMKANVYNIQARTGVLEGMASGDEPADQGLWINFLYTDSEKDKDGLIDGYEAETAGVIVGYDRQVTPAFALGLAYTYATTDAETDIGSEDFDLDESLLSLYGNYETNSWFGEGQLSYGWGEVDGERQAVDLYKFDYDTDVLYARVMAGKHYYCPESNWVLSPFGSIDYAKIEMDSYTEEGGAMALEVDPDDFDSMNLGAGIKVENRGATLTPEFKLIAYYDVIGDEIETSSKFVGGTTSFTSTGDEADRFSWDVGAALTFGKADSPLTFKVGYDLVGSEDFTSHNFNGKLRYEF